MMDDTTVADLKLTHKRGSRNSKIVAEQRNKCNVNQDKEVKNEGEKTQEFKNSHGIRQFGFFKNVQNKKNHHQHEEKQKVERERYKRPYTTKG